MQQSSESFWTDIKTYEELLKKEPSSYCFAPLAEVYLKVGMIDDALAVARAGVARYPGYAAGQMALARACQEKGLQDECCAALEAVTAAAPDQIEAQRMLARLYAQTGRSQDAARVLKTLLDFSPDDTAARIELEAMQRSAGYVASVDDDDDLELIELSESDIYEEPEPDLLVERVRPSLHPDPVEDPWAAISATPVKEEQPLVADPWIQPAQQEPPVVENPWDSPSIAEAVAPATAQDPLMTATLAELYVSQGFTDKALEIYREILAASPDNAVAAARITELEMQVQPAAGYETAVPTVEPVVADAVPSEGSADSATVAVLEGWLENIRRIRECR